MTRFALAIVLAPTLAAAAPYEVVAGDANRAGIVLARQEVPAVAASGGDRALSKVIYLNRSGVTITPGSSDARVNRSSVTKQAATIPAWNPSPEVWAETVACLEGMFLPFDVELTEVDPGTKPHIEAVFGGKPQLLNLGPRVGGVAPLSSVCGVVENAMVFTFTEIMVQDGQVVCETMAQEIAHAYGLDHEMLAADPMSYLSHDGLKAFQNVSAACGESSARPCGIGPMSCRAEQNSYEILMQRLGPSGVEPLAAPEPMSPQTEEVTEVGCSATGGSSGILFGLAAMLGLRRRRAR